MCGASIPESLKGAGLCDYAIFVAGRVRGGHQELFHRRRTTMDVRLQDILGCIVNKNLNRIIAEPGPL